MGWVSHRGSDSDFSSTKFKIFEVSPSCLKYCRSCLDPAISCGFSRPFLVAQRSKKPNIDFGRTPVKSTIWSHNGQKDRFVISGLGQPKRGKNSWRETFGTIGVKVRSLTRSKFWKFDSWSHLKMIDPGFNRTPSKAPFGRTTVKKTDS